MLPPLDLQGAVGLVSQTLAGRAWLFLAICLGGPGARTCAALCVFSISRTIHITLVSEPCLIYLSLVKLNVKVELRNQGFSFLGLLGGNFGDKRNLLFPTISTIKGCLA